jgi:hypothetical protein
VPLAAPAVCRILPLIDFRLDVHDIVSVALSSPYGHDSRKFNGLHLSCSSSLRWEVELRQSVFGGQEKRRGTTRSIVERSYLEEILEE